MPENKLNCFKTIIWLQNEAEFHANITRWSHRTGGYPPRCCLIWDFTFKCFWLSGLLYDFGGFYSQLTNPIEKEVFRWVIGLGADKFIFFFRCFLAWDFICWWQNRGVQVTVSLRFTPTVWLLWLCLVGTTNPSTFVLWAVILFIAQVIASKIRLFYHRYGPVEWLWRRISYGKMK